MNGKEIITHAVRAEMPDMEQMRDNCVIQAQTTTLNQHGKRPGLRFAIPITATAAVLAVMLFGNTFLHTQTGNAFSINAYAMEIQDDGTVSKFALNDQIEDETGITTWSAMDGEYSYRGIAIECEGKNIQSVEFSADDDAMFAKMYVEIENGKIVYDKEFYDGDKLIGGRIEADPERIGSSFTLEMDEMTDNLILFAGKPTSDGEYIYPLDLTIRAVATFNDATTQEETFIVR